MQFLWKYVDDLMGKGLAWTVIVKLLSLASVKLVILALPLAILLSSIMVMGDFAENSELVAMKSAGLSLFRILRPLFLLITAIAVGAFFFTNDVWPTANLKFRTLLYDVTKKKPTIQLKENIFFNGIEGYTIRVGKKRESGHLKDVLIYDHSNPDHRGNRRVIRAQTGSMKKTKDERHLILTLNDGVMYQEMDRAQGQKKAGSAPLLRTDFDEQVIRFNLMGLRFQRSEEDLFSNDNEMLDLSQLNAMVDSLRDRMKKKEVERTKEVAKQLWVLRDSGRTKLGGAEPPIRKKGPDTLSEKGRKAALEMAKEKVRYSKGRAEILKENSNNRSLHIKGYLIEWHKKFTLSFACIVLFFIGGPLGAIIRKGGLGTPLVAAVLLFLLYHILTKSGQEMASEGAIPVWMGSWMAPALLLPLGIWLTYRAANDSKSSLSIKLPFQRLRKRIIGSDNSSTG